MPFDKRAEKAVPAADIFLFSAADDSEQAFGISNVDTDFVLPDPDGKSGGACTSALLQTLWKDEEDEDEDEDNAVRYTWAETLEMMREKIDELGLTQTPQLSASRPIDVDEPMCITPVNCKGVKRALLIGVNYTGDPNELTSCHSDIRNMKDFLIRVQGFERKNMLIMMDDGNHHEPTKQLILDSLQRLCEISRSGDCIFFQFSGHGGQLSDRNGDEADGKDEVIFPSDYETAGHITDDEIYSEFVARISPGVHVVAVMDSCHSGTVMDLPYVCRVGEEEMQRNESFKPVVAGTTAIVAAGAAAAAKEKKGKAKKGDKKGKKKKDTDSADKKTKKGKNGTKKKKKETEEGVSTADEEEDDGEEEAFEEVERPEPKKKKGLFGVFGRGKK